MKRNAPARTLLLISLMLICPASPLASQVPAGPPVVWPTSAGGNGHSYQLYLGAIGGWLGANTFAGLNGGYLATITSADENAFVYNLAAAVPAAWSAANGGTYGPWLGGAMIGGSFAWVTGEPFCFQHWAPGEPNNGCVGIPLEDHVHFGNQTIYALDLWNDLASPGCPAGGIVVPSFVVERSPYAFAMTQPGGPGAALVIAATGGTAGNLFFNAFTLAADPCLDGWFFGIEISFGDLATQLTSGPPFFGVLGPAGSAVFVVPPPIPAGITLDAVSIHISAFGLGPIAASIPITYTTI